MLAVRSEWFAVGLYRKSSTVIGIKTQSLGLYLAILSTDPSWPVLRVLGTVSTFIRRFIVLLYVASKTNGRNIRK